MQQAPVAGSSGAGSSSTTIAEAAGAAAGAAPLARRSTSPSRTTRSRVASTGSLAPGTYTFHVTNNGPSSHNLTINGPGVSDKATPTFAAGGSQDLTVTLTKGTYDLFCSVPGHKQLGMDTNLTVGSGGSGSAAAGGARRWRIHEERRFVLERQHCERRRLGLIRCGRSRRR